MSCGCCWHDAMVLSLLCPCRRIARVPADAVAGAQHVIGILPNDVDVHDAKDSSDSLLLRLSNKTEVGSLHRCLMASCTPVLLYIRPGTSQRPSLLLADETASWLSIEVFVMRDKDLHCTASPFLPQVWSGVLCYSSAGVSFIDLSRRATWYFYIWQLVKTASTSRTWFFFETLVLPRRGNSQMRLNTCHKTKCSTPVTKPSARHLSQNQVLNTCHKTKCLSVSVQADQWYRQLVRGHETMQQLVGPQDPSSPLDADWDTASVTTDQSGGHPDLEGPGWNAGGSHPTRSDPHACNLSLSHTHASHAKCEKHRCGAWGLQHMHGP